MFEKYLFLTHIQKKKTKKLSTTQHHVLTSLSSSCSNFKLKSTISKISLISQALVIYASDVLYSGVRDRQTGLQSKFHKSTQ